MAFDIEGARKAGYSDAEIADHLAKSSGFDAASARKSGYSDAELVQHLTKMQSAEQPMWPRVRKIVAPYLQGAASIGGGIVGAGAGTLAGPVGTAAGAVGGAGLGYAGAEQLLRIGDEVFGDAKRPSAVEAWKQAGNDLATGGAYEAGGQAAANVVGRGLQAAAQSGVGQRVRQYFTSAKGKAAKIARDAAGPNVDKIKNALDLAPEGETAAQATGGINAPVWQTLNARVAKRDPGYYGGGPLTPAQEAEAANALAGLAGGTNQTAMKTARGNALQNLTDEQIPILERELAAANTAGRLKPALDNEAQRMANAAAAKVEDVRRFTAAGERAGERAATTTTVPGYPRVPGRYTYMGELEKRAEQVAADAADTSLLFGEASRFAKSGADSLEAYGLKPLMAADVQAGLAGLKGNPKDAGNDILKRSLKQLSDDIAEWTKKNGVLSADALYALRKNSVNTVIQDVMKGAEAKAINAATADVMGKVKPIIDDAIVNAGGTGYKQYLEDYAKGRQLIDQQKLGAKAAELFRTNKQQFVDLVEGNRVEDVRKIFGWGKDQYDLAKQMSAEAMATLKGTADLTGRGIKAGEQAALGQEALTKIISDNLTRFKIPWGLSAKTAAMNRALDIAEHRLGTKTMNILAEGMKNGASARELLSYLPAKERVNLFRVLQELPAGVGVGAGNALEAAGAD